MSIESKKMPCAAIAGHIGVGHANSHMGLVQDDAVGFSALVSILMRVRPTDMTVTQVLVDNGEVEVILRGGGRGQASCLERVSSFEKTLLRNAEGMCELSSQTLASRVFGRVVGQGVGKLSSVLALAHARAMLREIQRIWPEETLYAADDTPGGCGEFLGGMLRLGENVYGWILTINASANGLGPVEDSEGLVPIGNKGRLMDHLGMTTVPCIVLESKAYSPELSGDLVSTTPWIRWNNEVDNPVVGACLIQAAEQLGYHPQHTATAYARRKGEMREATRRMGQRISQLGQAYSEATSAAVKVRIAGELADLLTHEVGGTSFMSDHVHEIAGGGGLWPGKAAVLSLLASGHEYAETGIIAASAKDIAILADICITALSILAGRLPEALKYVDERMPNMDHDALLRT